MIIQHEMNNNKSYVIFLYSYIRMVDVKLFCKDMEEIDHRVSESFNLDCHCITVYVRESKHLDFLNMIMRKANLIEKLEYDGNGCFEDDM